MRPIATERELDLAYFRTTRSIASGSMRRAFSVCLQQNPDFRAQQLAGAEDVVVERAEQRPVDVGGVP